MPREMISAYAIVKKACAIANRNGGRLSDANARLISAVCDEILAGEHADMFPLHVWMTGSGTQFNMNVNEVIANRCSQLVGAAHAPGVQRAKRLRVGDQVGLGAFAFGPEQRARQRGGRAIDEVPAFRVGQSPRRGAMGLPGHWNRLRTT